MQTCIQNTHFSVPGGSNIQTYKQTCMHANIQTYKHANMHTYIQTNIQTYKQTNSAQASPNSAQVSSNSAQTNIQTYKQTNIQHPSRPQASPNSAQVSPSQVTWRLLSTYRLNIDTHIIYIHRAYIHSLLCAARRRFLVLLVLGHLDGPLRL